MKSRITTQRAPMSTSNIRHFNLSEPHRAANEARGMLRHPRSLIRITPGWRAPRFALRAGGSTALVHVSRRRMSPLMWRRLSQQQPPEGEDLFLVTVSVECPRWMAGESTRLLELTLDRAWIVREDPQETRDRHNQAQVSLTWHGLMTQRDLLSKEGSTPRAA